MSIHRQQSFNVSIRAPSQKKKKKTVHDTNFDSVDFAAIPVLDLGLVELPGGKDKLVAQLKDAVEQTGMATSSPAFYQ